MAVTLLICAVCGSATTAAQTSGNSDPRTTRKALWTVVGAAAGFGVGLWAGLHAFDDAIDSDRKVWTTAFVAAAGGGIAGFLIGRRGTRPDLGPAFRTLREGALGGQFAPRTAPRLGTGEFRGWLTNGRLSHKFGRRLTTLPDVPDRPTPIQR
jgi:hypothetical protein